ncbi:MAG: DUF2922 domain-containing protein [Defluviitaleaceae bacterium]|nr:DUF2922 domain-containing protein [Defluviitaleaceae bacterium]
MTETRQTCVLTFRTSLDGRKTVRINDPRPGLILGNIRAAEESLIEIPIFDPTIGNLVALTGAELVTEDRVTIL